MLPRHYFYTKTQSYQYFCRFAIVLAQGTFNTKLGTFAAVAGSVVGLGNIWRFPYLAGDNGGFAFLIIYLFVSLLISMPLMLSEFSIGRSQRCNAMRAFRNISSGPWFLIGFLGVATAYVIDSFYMVVGGWSLKFLQLSIVNAFADMSAADIKGTFGHLLSNGTQLVLWSEATLVIATAVIIGGVSNGIEKFNKYLMPILLLLLIILAVNSIFFLPDSYMGLQFLFYPDFSKITFQTVLKALGQSFFSLSLGMGAMLTYSAYMSNSQRLPCTALSIVSFDTIVAVISGLAIFPAVFSFGIDPSAGPELLFITMPAVFSKIIGGQFLAILFFLLVFLAASTSQVSLLEVVTAYVSEELHIPRRKAAILIFLTMTCTGGICALSLTGAPSLTFFDMSVFDIFDYVSSNIMLPIGGLLIVLFAGWIMPKRILHAQLTNNADREPTYFKLIRFLIRFVAPVFVSILFLHLIGFF
ncbi:MAG: sodium-dependent transporter [Paludibacteraceae bacterium]|nr:sodium-dependent transporter [Paludibacteraceae bacterium]